MSCQNIKKRRPSSPNQTWMNRPKFEFQNKQYRTLKWRYKSRQNWHDSMKLVEFSDIDFYFPSCLSYSYFIGDSLAT